MEVGLSIAEPVLKNFDIPTVGADPMDPAIVEGELAKSTESFDRQESREPDFEAFEERSQRWKERKEERQRRRNDVKGAAFQAYRSNSGFNSDCSTAESDGSVDSKRFHSDPGGPTSRFSSDSDAPASPSHAPASDERLQQCLNTTSLQEALELLHIHSDPGVRLRNESKASEALEFFCFNRNRGVQFSRFASNPGMDHAHTKSAGIHESNVTTESDGHIRCRAYPQQPMRLEENVEKVLGPSKSREAAHSAAPIAAHAVSTYSVAQSEEPLSPLHLRRNKLRIERLHTKLPALVSLPLSQEQSPLVIEPFKVAALEECPSSPKRVKGAAFRHHPERYSSSPV